MSNRFTAPISVSDGQVPQLHIDAPLPSRRDSRSSKRKVLCVFGTRPEIIKLAPIIRELKQQPGDIQTLTVMSGQHTDLLEPFLKLFQVRPDFDLQVMERQQTPNEVCARVPTGLGPIVRKEVPDMVVIQGDTTTALAGALTGFHHKNAVAHVEAGLRSGDPGNPFPEEMNRRLISRLTTYHFAATSGNRELLLREGVPTDEIFVTGNPVVDALRMVLDLDQPFSDPDLLNQIGNRKCIVLTTHRRESFGRILEENLKTLSQFVREHEDVVLIFPMHPNPNVSGPTKKILSDNPRTFVIDPLPYRDFIHLLAKS